MMNKIKKPVFIIGFPRSGTTVLAEAIAVHKAFGWFSNYYNLMPSFPELSILNRVIDLPGIGWKLRGKKKQNSNILSTFRKLFPYSVEAYSVWEKYCGEKFLYDYLLNQTANTDEKGEIEKAILKVLKFQGKSRFLAKITGPSRITYLKSIFNDAIFIHVLRDPKAVVSSLLKVDFWKRQMGLKEPWWRNGLSEESIAEWKSSDKDPIVLAAIQWRDIIKNAWDEKVNINSHDYFEIKYEKFVENPRETLKSIMKRLNLTYLKDMDRYITTYGKVKDMNYKFKQNLQTSDLKKIMQVTGPTANQAGYF
jgi:LPS sulfotransferase NodH